MIVCVIVFDHFQIFSLVKPLVQLVYENEKFLTLNYFFHFIL